MSTNEFLSELQRRIAAYDLLCHPFYQAWSAGELTRNDLRNYALQYYPHVRAFPEYLGSFAGRLPDGSMRDGVIANMNDEIGAGDTANRSHAELWLDFAQGMGAERVEANDLPGEISALITFFRSIAESGAPEETLAAFYAYESQVPRIAQTKERGLREFYGADDFTCGYFTVHATADVHHANVWRSLLMRQAANDEDAANRALDAAETASKTLWRALDGIEAARHCTAA